jgi:hypothetical protein
MNKKCIIRGSLAFSCLLAAALVKAHCCNYPDDRCSNWHVIYTDDPTQAIETDDGKLLKIERGEANSLVCPNPRCRHPLSDHWCDAGKLPVGPRLKPKK